MRAPLGTFASADSLVLVVEPWGLSNAGATEAQDIITLDLKVHLYSIQDLNSALIVPQQSLHRALTLKTLK